jgi:hypothetical protein
MTNVTISGLPNLSNITPGSLFAVDAANTTYNTTAVALQSFVLNTTGNIATGNLSASGNVVANIVNANTINFGGSVSAPGNVSGLNILTAGYVSATGNVYGSAFVGNGRALTGIPAQSLATGNFLIQQSGTNLVFSFNGTNIAILSSTGTFTTLNNITAYGL